MSDTPTTTDIDGNEVVTLKDAVNAAPSPSFWGVVVLKEWIGDPKTGRQIRGFIGKVSIKAAESVLGFRTSSSESNWIAVIEGRNDVYGQTDRVSIPGCQVRAILESKQSVDTTDYSHVGDSWHFGKEPENVQEERF